MFRENLQTLAQQHLLRELSLINSPSAPVISVEGREVLLFASNNYLGLANHHQVKDAAMKAIASEMRSASLSGWPSETDSEVHKKHDMLGTCKKIRPKEYHETVHSAACSGWRPRKPC